ncbi:uncharacterized protein FIBRA_02519 [Fibroporia radiculosa]|uniref:Cytochrome P450 n=1 Tax=Fibroporia radiculosa TaxID=599839 RepID=J4GMX9_9APHY|nr:uncharacterized protein FIBRA_02519 [Fibroporia radiculosa]CCM00485.1 predicted protein [Fibroporia radiculosa]
MVGSLSELALLTPILYAAYLLYMSLRRRMGNIPTVGGTSFPVLSYRGSFHNIFHAAETIREGYAKYKGHAFKYAELGNWRVIITGQRQIDELCKAPDTVISFAEAANDSAQIVYTFAPEVHHDPYHAHLIRTQLTRNLARIFPEMHDELMAAFNDEVRVVGEDWTRVRLKDAVTEIGFHYVSSMVLSNTLIAKAESGVLGRNSDYCLLNKTFTRDVIGGAFIIKLFPRALRPLVSRFCTSVPARINRGIKHLEPTIKERFEQIEKHGKNWADKPNDMLQWLIDAAQGKERTVRALVLRVLAVNFAAIHTTSVTFTQVMYYLAAHPQYASVLREEIEALVQQEGWTKAAVDKMHKTDSFVKEVQRFTGLGAYAINRKALKDFTFADGTFIPAGTMIAASARPIHFDDENYANPDMFNPWRFSNMRTDEGTGLKYQMISTSTQYLPFGHGKNACPGRFFAANEVKAMLAHVVMTYDVKTVEDGVIPPPFWVLASLVPNGKADVLFRKRQT